MPHSPEVVEQSISVFALMTQLDAQMWRENMSGWLIDLFVDNDTFYAIIGDEGRLYKASVDVGGGVATLGASASWELVEINHVPATPTEEEEEPTPANQIPLQDDNVPLLPLVGQSSSFSITRMADGTYRWLSLAATAIMNRSGQLDTRALFDSFIADIEQTKVYPTLRFFHLMDDDYILGSTDFVARDGFCYVTSGILDPSAPLSQALLDDIAESPEFWGTSIGFYLNDEPTMLDFGGITIPTFQSGRNHEISVLPEKDAACLRTSFAIAQSREGNTMDPRIKEALARLNVDPATIEDDVDQANELAADPTVISRSTEEAEVEVEEDEDEVDELGDGAPVEQVTDLEDEDQEEVPEAIIEVDEAFTQAVNDAVTEQLLPIVAGINEGVLQAVDALVSLGERLSDLEAAQAEADAERLADHQADLVAQAAELSPAVAMRLSVNHRPRTQNSDTAPDDTTDDNRAKGMDDLAEAVLSNLPQY